MPGSSTLPPNSYIFFFKISDFSPSPLVWATASANSNFSNWWPPSINESFGLPLIEAINHECMVIAPNLPYVNEIIIPSINFDPFSTQSISSSIREAVKNSNLKASKIIIENKIDTFVKYVYENIW